MNVVILYIFIEDVRIDNKTESNQENVFRRASVVAGSAQLFPGQSENKRGEWLRTKGDQRGQCS